MDLIEFIRDLDAQLSLVERKLWVLHRKLGVPAYDFAFVQAFECSHPPVIEPGMPCVARIGVPRGSLSAFGFGWRATSPRRG